MFDRITRELADHAAIVGRVPGIAIVMVGDEPPRASMCRRSSVRLNGSDPSATSVLLDASTTSTRLREALADLSADPTIGGVIIQQPLPAHLDMRRAIGSLDPPRTSTASIRSTPGSCREAISGSLRHAPRRRSRSSVPAATSWRAGGGRDRAQQRRRQAAVSC